MNTAQLDRFNRFFDDHHQGVLAEVAGSDPSRSRSPDALRLRVRVPVLEQVEDDGDPVGWVHRVIAEDRRYPGHAAGRDPVDDADDRPSAEASTERRRIVALARRQRAVATVVIGTSALAFLGAELFVAHR